MGRKLARLTNDHTCCYEKVKITNKSLIRATAHQFRRGQHREFQKNPIQMYIGARHNRLSVLFFFPLSLSSGLQNGFFFSYEFRFVSEFRSQLHLFIRPSLTHALVQLSLCHSHNIPFLKLLHKEQHIRQWSLYRTSKWEIRNLFMNLCLLYDVAYNHSMWKHNCVQFI